MDLNDKNVIYAGGFGGIGQAWLKESLKQGVKNLAILDLKENAEVLQELQNSYPAANIFFVQFDIAKRDSIEAAFKLCVDKMAHFDVLINGCGVLDDSCVELTLNINLLGLIHSTFAALPYMDKSVGGRGGIIVNISSVAGLEPFHLFAIYSAAKHGVIAFTRSMAHPFYFDRFGVKFITICPGITETSLVANLHTKVTFGFGQEAANVLNKADRQSAETCAKNMIKVIEMCKNGGVYLIDVDEIKEISYPLMWKPTFKSV